MPRQPRILSNTNIYHIMVRGINKEQIFKKEIYKAKVIETLKEIREKLIFHIIAYCIMDNHMHLLIKAEEYELTTLMKKLNIKYAMYYNNVEKRYGHVFQDRFKSEAVEDDKYMLGVIRHIHNNPIKAKMSKDIIKYPWSSARDYINQNSDLISNKYINEILNIFNNKNEFMKFHSLNDDNLYIDIKEEEQENKQKIINKTIEIYINKYQIVDQKQANQEQKIELAVKLLKLNICTLRKIAELCNLTVNSVSKLKKEMKE